MAKWKDVHNNTVLRFVPRPQAIAGYFLDANKVDIHNQARQHDLHLEKCWVTRCGFFRLATTLFGMCVVDAWKTYRHHVHSRHRHHEIELIDFVSILVKDLFDNTLTRKINTPPRTFNVGMIGYELALPDNHQDPEVPEFERQTQDSVFALPGEDPEEDDRLQSAMPSRSVEEGTHGLRKINEFVFEQKAYTDAKGNELTRQVKRRKRGRCVHCGQKTPFYCPKCSETKSGKYWCCGLDVPDGRICQATHDSKWIFDGSG